MCRCRTAAASESGDARFRELSYVVREFIGSYVVVSLTVPELRKSRIRFNGHGNTRGLEHLQYNRLKLLGTQSAVNAYRICTEPFDECDRLFGRCAREHIAVLLESNGADKRLIRILLDCKYRSLDLMKVSHGLDNESVYIIARPDDLIFKCFDGILEVEVSQRLQKLSRRCDIVEDINILISLRCGFDRVLTGSNDALL